MQGRRPRTQQGAVTLLLALGLLVLGTLASLWSSRVVLGDQLSTSARDQALQARSAAQAVLATTQADVMSRFENSPFTDPFTDPFSDAQQHMSCPAPLTGPRWQCTHWPLPQGAAPAGWQAEAWAARDLLLSPHVWQLHARAREDAGRGQAWVQESVFAPVLAPAPINTPSAALLLNGCFSAAAGSRWQLCPLSATGQACTGTSTALAVRSFFVPDSDLDGTLSATERSQCLPLGPAQLPGGGSVVGPDGPAPRSPCARAVWRSVFGDTTPAQLQAWSQAQADNGLHRLSQPTRSIYWVDSPADWTQDLGQPDAPVLLVFSAQACALRCPRIATGVQIHGTVFVEAGCDDEKLRGWQAGTIDGLLAIEAGLPAATGNSLVRAQGYAHRAHALHWPEGQDVRQAQRVAGSHREGTP